MPFVWLVRAQMLCAAGILLWLAAGVAAAARDGFEPARARYGQSKMDLGAAARTLRPLLPREGARVVFLGDDEPAEDGRPGQVAQLRDRLRQQGADVVETGAAGVYEAAAGADLLCVFDPAPQNLDLDWARLAAAMRGKFVFDFTTLLPEGEADAAGLEAYVYGHPQWPAWLDPEFRRFAAHVRATVPEDAGILLAPSQPFQTAVPRARWFLQLNYALAPRRLYQWRSVQASGYVMQYFDWVVGVNEFRPWEAANPVRLRERPLTRLLSSAANPVRTLAPAELEAARALGAEWILFYNPNIGFRLVDWEILPLERVLSWPVQGS